MPVSQSEAGPHIEKRQRHAPRLNKMKMKPFVITEIASRNVKRLENTQWLNRFARFSCKNRTIKLI